MKKERTPFDPLSRASYPQMRSGGVRLQTLAIFTYPKAGSTELGREQIEIFQELPRKYSDCFEILSDVQKLKKPSDKVFILPAFENASGFCEEGEPLESGLGRLQHIHEKLKRILYISLTWDGENRFGGGNGSDAGLKSDGKQLLFFLNQKKIAVDLSHTSDKLAHDILNFIDQYKLEIPVIASHSNFRSVTDIPRNLPDEIALEIIKRKGIIGFNFFSCFIGLADPHRIVKHLEHGLKLGGDKALSFGADFFCDTDFPSLKTKYNTGTFFFDPYSDSSKYPTLLDLFKSNLSLPPELLHDIALGNFTRFLSRLWS
jgi:microsomal dipeptidase-like Zn-dependent dipeptidase